MCQQTQFAVFKNSIRSNQKIKYQFRASHTVTEIEMATQSLLEIESHPKLEG